MSKRAYQVYLAGPMTNLPGFNFPLFFHASSYLRGVLGWQVMSPAEKDLASIPERFFLDNVTGNLQQLVEETAANGTPFTLTNAMEWDLPAILASDGIVLLPGWENSTGARYERTVAEALGREIWIMTPGDVGDPMEYHLVKDADQQRMTKFMREFPIWLDIELEV